MCPMMSLNGAFLVVAFGQVFRVYWANGSNEAQFG